MFSGRTTEDSQRIVIYKEADNEFKLHVRFPDLNLEQELWALSPDYKLYTQFEIDTQLLHIRLEDPFWTGEAKGSPLDLLNEPDL